MNNVGRTKATLCWKCRKSTNSGCSWSRSLEPVEGCDAVKDHLSTNYKDNISYCVLDCPEFERDVRNTCETCRHFERKGESSMYGYCRENKRATDIHRICGKMKRRKS